MDIFPYIFLLLGLFLLILIPFLILKVKNDPISVLRPQWRNTTSAGFAITVGIIVILAAFLGGLWSIWTGISLL